MPASTKTGVSPYVQIKLNGQDVSEEFLLFEWASFVNGGYTIRAKLNNAYYSILNLLISDNYLTTARLDSAEVKFKIKWLAEEKLETTELPAIVTHLGAGGTPLGGVVDLIAVDPPSFYLNRGDSSGKIWKGKVSKVIEDVVGEYAPSISYKVSETSDNEENYWPQMRQDPKTFIHSLLDWSAPITSSKKEDRWVVASGTDDGGSPKIFIHKVSEISPLDLGLLRFNTTTGDEIQDIVNFEMLSNNFISAVQTKLITQGLSSISGQYMDRITDTEEKKVYVKDKNTGDKVNTNIGPDRGFKKPKDKDWATNVISVPEFNDGALGIPYEDYVSGRARGVFIDVLNMVMRVKFRSTGIPELSDSTKLGATTVNIGWKDSDDQPFFLGGKWIVYGFHHTVVRDQWFTDMYCYRIDYDSTAKVI